MDLLAPALDGADGYDDDRPFELPVLVDDGGWICSQCQSHKCGSCSDLRCECCGGAP